ncbi:MAG: hypothetical protein AAFQ80_03170 [Cyanobacteria bacterium J06621_8]
MLKFRNIASNYVGTTLITAMILSISGCGLLKAPMEIESQTFSQFVDDIQSKQIKQVILDPKMLQANILTVDNQQLLVALPNAPDYIFSLLNANSIDYRFQPQITISDRLRLMKWNNLPEVSYSEFLQKVKAREVETIIVTSDRFLGRCKAVDGSEFKVYLPQSRGSNLIDILSENGVYIGLDSNI